MIDVNVLAKKIPTSGEVATMRKEAKAMVEEALCSIFQGVDADVIDHLPDDQLTRCHELAATILLKGGPAFAAVEDLGRLLCFVYNGAFYRGDGKFFVKDL